MEKHRWIIVVVILFILGLFSIMVAGILGIFITDIDTVGNVALIPIKGIIMTDSGSSVFDSKYVSSTKIVEAIKTASDKPNIEAIVLEINSPGGAPVASDEIAQAIKNSNKTVVAWIREMGASGGYYIASACDTIVTHEMSITGSLGVIGSYLEFADLLTEYNVTYRRLVAGEHKDMGSPYKRLSIEEEKLWQNKLDIIHEIFIDEIITNRNLEPEEVKNLATGEIFLGVEAKELGLVDILGGKDEVTDYLEEKLNITVEYSTYQEKIGLIELLSSMMNENSFLIGDGIGSALKTNNNMVKPII